jgi:acyl carrier protein
MKAKHMNPNTTKTEVFNAISALLEDKSIVVTEDLSLIGSDSVLDSMKLVELCLALEDKAADLGFEFDWTSDAAMSKSRSMFRTAGALAAEFLSQMESKK